MNNSEKTIEQKIKEITEGLLGEKEIGVNDDLKKDWLLDSLDHVELTMAIENEFSIRINDEDVPNLKSINDFTQHVEKLI